MIQRIFLFLLCVSCSYQSLAQELKTQFYPPYKLSTAVNSVNGEISPIFNATTNSLYFTRMVTSADHSGEKHSQRVFLSLKKGNNWNIPDDNLGVLNRSKSNAIIGMEKDGKTLYMLQSNGENEVPQINQYKYVNSEWILKTKMSIDQMSYATAHLGLSVSDDGQVLLVSIDNQKKQSHDDELYVSFREGNNWSKPVWLGATVNTTKDEFAPYYHPATQLLFFSSTGHEGFGGADIFVAKKIGGDWTNWTKPKNLGPLVNSAGFDAYLTIAQDSSIYFSSDRGGRYSDIYSTKLKSAEVEYSTASGFVTIQKLPAENIELELIDENDVVLHTAKTNAEGFFDFQDYLPETNFKINIKDKDKAKLANSNIYLASGIADKVHYVDNDSLGLFAFSVLSGKKYESIKHLTEMTEGGLVVNKPTSISGIFNLEDEIKANVPIKLLDEQDNVIQSAVTDEFGRFKFKNFLPNKNYIIAIDDDKLGGQAEVYEVYLKQDDKNSVVINKMEKELFGFRMLPPVEAEELVPEKLVNVVEDYKAAESVTAQRILFDRNETSINQEEYQKLNVVIEQLKSSPAEKILLTGFTCTLKNNEEYNTQTAFNRVLAVKQYLVTLGIPNRAITYQILKARSAKRCDELERDDRSVGITISQ